MDIIKENISNLTGLWKVAGERANAFHYGNGYNYCEVAYSEWPNRFWFLEEFNSTSVIEAREILQSLKTTVKISHWDFYNIYSEKIFNKYGLVKTSEQIGMSLKLPKKFNNKGMIRLDRVTRKDQAVLWSGLFKKAFNYSINEKLVMLSRNDIDYLIAYHQNYPVGTCMVYSDSKEVVGIHSLGIIPKMRRKGYAQEVFLQVLNQSIESGFEYATLQASEMAKPMYDELGFSTDFIMENYQLNTR